MADFEVNIILRARDEASAALAGLEQKARSIGQGTRGRRGGAGIGGLNFGAAAGGVRQLTNAARSAVGTPLALAANFEAALNQVNAFSGGSFQQLGQLDKIAAKSRELGSSTEFTATESANAFAILTQAGFTYEQQLESINTVLDFATSGQVDMAKAAGIVGGTIGAFALETSEAGRVADVLAKISTRTQSNIVLMGSALKDAGPAAETLGIDLEDTAAALGVFGKAAITGGRAGKSLRTILMRLNPSTATGRKTLKALGISVKDMRKELESGDIAKPIKLLEEAMTAKGLTGATRLKVLENLFDKRQATNAALLIKSVSDEVQGTTKSLAFFQKEARGANGSLTTMADIMRSGTKANAKRLQSALEEMGISVGEQLLPVLAPLIESATKAAVEFGKWAKENPGLVKTLGGVLIAVVGIGTVLGPLLLTLASLQTLLGGTALARGLGTLASGFTAASVEALALKTNVGVLIGSKAGLVGMLGAAAAAGAAGFAFGQWMDNAFGLSDALASVNQHIGRPSRRAPAIAESLTDEEKVARSAATARKKELEAELAANEESFFSDGDRQVLSLFGSDALGRTDETIEGEINAQQAKIDRINAKGLDRQAQLKAANKREQALKVGTVGAEDPAAGKTIGDLVTGPLEAGGEVRVIVEDGRVKVNHEKAGDIPIAVEAGPTLEGA